jgi:hypothetical protein
MFCIHHISLEFGVLVSDEPEELEIRSILTDPEVASSPVFKSRVFMFDSAHCALGISFWAIPFVYGYAQNLFFQVRERERLQGEGEDEGEEKGDRSQLLRVTSILLLLHPDTQTYWSIRKECILHGEQTVCDELQFVAFVFSKHPKSTEGWEHRRFLWTIVQALLHDHRFVSSAGFHLDQVKLGKGLNITGFREKEQELCEKCVTLYRKNYHAWTHWGVIFECANREEIVETLRANAERCRMNVSDYCGFHLRTTLFRLLRGCTPEEKWNGGEAVKWCKSELDANKEAIERYPSHESLWKYRSFLVVFFGENVLQRDDDALLLEEVEWVFWDVICVDETAFASLSEESHKWAMTHVLRMVRSLTLVDEKMNCTHSSCGKELKVLLGTAMEAISSKMHVLDPSHATMWIALCKKL